MKFSLIIINYQKAQLSAQCLSALLTFFSFNDKEIILIDNGSNDNSLEFLKQKFTDKVKYIANHENLGFAKAANQGAKLAQGEILVFLNNDTIVKDDFLSRAEKIFKNNQNIAAISPLIKLSNGRYQNNSFGPFPTFWRLLLQKTKEEIKIKSGADYQIVDWLSGCALLIKKSVFTQMAGFDENFFLYYEDIDLAKRLSLKNYQSALALKTEIIHLDGQSFKNQAEKKSYYYQSQDYYFKKHYNLFIVYLIKIARFFYKSSKKIIHDINHK